MSEQDDFVSKFFLTLTEEIGSLLHKNRRKTLSITFYYNSNNSSRCLRKLYDFVRQEFLKSLFKNKGSSWVFLYIFLSINFFFLNCSLYLPEARVNLLWKKITPRTSKHLYHKPE